MRYTVVLTDEVKAKLHALPLALRREIGHQLFLLENDLAGNVKKLKGSQQDTGCGSAITGCFLNSSAQRSRCTLLAYARTSIDGDRRREENCR